MIPSLTVVYVGGGSAVAPGTALEQSGMAVERAEGIVDGLKRLQTTSADCLVAELALPDGGVAELVSLVHRDHPSLPVVLVGEAEDPATLSSALAAGVSEYVPTAADGTLADCVRRVASRRRADEALDGHAQLGQLAASIARATLAADDRVAVERAVYDRLVDAGLYRFAWIGEYAGETGQLRLRVPVDGTFDPASLDVVGVDGDPKFIERAVRERTVAVASGSAHTRSASGAAPVTSTSIGPPPAESLITAAVPLACDGEIHGLVLLSSSRPDAFDASERSVLIDLAEVVAHALGRVAPADTSTATREFAENVTHELRNPLGVALAHLRIGREQGDPDAFDEVEAALRRMEDQLESLASELVFDAVDETTVRDVAATATEAWDRANLAAADLEIRESGEVAADHDLLGRLFGNLFRNAVTHAGTDATVRIGRLDGGFYVEDDGPGIPPDDRTRVFDRGFSTADRGLGIGLDIVRQIAEIHGWTVSATDAEDGGARFEITGVGPIEEASEPDSGEVADGA